VAERIRRIVAARAEAATRDLATSRIGSWRPDVLVLPG